MNELVNFKKSVLEAMGKTGKTYPDVAAAIGMRPDQLKKLITGSGGVTLATMENISKALGRELRVMLLPPGVDVMLSDAGGKFALTVAAPKKVEAVVKSTTTENPIDQRVQKKIAKVGIDSTDDTVVYKRPE